MQKKTATKKAAPKKSIVKPAVSDTRASFNIDEINSILKAVKSSGVNELKLEKGDFKITIRQGQPIVSQAPALPAVAPAVASPVAPVMDTLPPAEKKETPPAQAAPDTTHLVTIYSPMIGTFYRSPGPDKPPFINVGDVIKEGDVLCIVEAMKLFNEIESEISGKIVKVLVDDASPVEYDQPLFLVEP